MSEMKTKIIEILKNYTEADEFASCGDVVIHIREERFEEIAEDIVNEAPTKQPDKDLSIESVSGSATKSVFDDKIDEWHEGDSKQPLHEYLGLTKEQYMLWLRKPELVEKHYRNL
jgi:hypothetical protein